MYRRVRNPFCSSCFLSLSRFVYIYTMYTLRRSIYCPRGKFVSRYSLRLHTAVNLRRTVFKFKGDDNRFVTEKRISAKTGREIVRYKNYTNVCWVRVGVCIFNWSDRSYKSRRTYFRCHRFLVNQLGFRRGPRALFRKYIKRRTVVR